MTRFTAILVGAAVVLSALVRLAHGQASTNSSDFDRPDRRPYRVAVEIAVADGALVDEADRERLRREVGNACRRTFGGSWAPDVRGNDWLPVPTAGALERMNVDDMVALFEVLPVDKVFAVVVQPNRGGHSVGVREFDVSTRRLGLVVTRQVRGRTRLPSVIFEAIHEAFEPIASLDDVDGENVELTPLASGFRTPDPTARRVRAGDFVVPYLRYVLRSGEVKRTRTFPWTYVRVEKGNRSGTLVSGIRLPLDGKPKRTVQKLALATRARFPETSVRLFPRGSSRRPYVGTRVEVARKLRGSDENEEQPESLLTDRDGRVFVMPDDEQPLSWLYVFSGRRELLARVPLLAGSVSAVDFPLPDDMPRLEFEGTVELMQSNLVAAVARREGLVQRIRVLARDAQWDRIDAPVDGLLAQLNALPNTDVFEDRLAILRTRQLAAADEIGNKVAALRIRRMAEETEALVERYLDPQRIDDLLTELKDLRKLDAQDAAGFD